VALTASSPRRARSVPLGLEASNPFWSEGVRAEAALRAARPRDLGTPLESTPLPLEGERKRQRSGERRSFYRTPPNSWMEGGEAKGPRPMSYSELREMVHRSDKDLQVRFGQSGAESSMRSMGQMPEELPEKTEGPVPGRQTLEEAVSEELVQTLLEQNAALQEQLQRMMAERDAKEEKEKEERQRPVESASQWSAVTALEEKQVPMTPQRPRMRSAEAEDRRRTPGGTQVPADSPPGLPELPPWPPSLAPTVNFLDYEKIEMDTKRGRNGDWVWIPGGDQRSGSRPRPPPEPWEMEKVDEKRARHEDRTAWLEQQVLQLQEMVMKGAEGHPFMQGSFFVVESRISEGRGVEKATIRSG